MHTVIVIAGGLAFFGVCLIAGRWLGYDSTDAPATALKAFLPLWMAASLLNAWIGVKYAGYSWADELPIVLLVFGIPALIAAAIVWRF